MLANLREELKQVAAGVLAGTAGKKQRDALRQRRTMLGGSLQAWQPLHHTYATFRDLRIINHTVVKYAKPLTRELAEYAESVRDNPYGSGASHPKTLQLFNEYKNEFEQELETQLLRAWQSHLEAEHEAIVGDLLLERYDYGTYAATVAQIQQVRAQLQRCARKLPGASQFPRPVHTECTLDADLQYSKSLLAILRQHIESLPNEPLPDDVHRFLQAAKTPEGASLQLLTSAVQEWLFKHGAQDRFRAKEVR